MAWRSDSAQLVTVSGDPTVKIWDASTGECEGTLSDDYWDPNAVAWNPSGTTVATTDFDDLILWESGDTIERIEDANEGTIYEVRWSPDGTSIATAGSNHATVWDMQTKECIADVAAHGTFLNTVAWSPDSERIATAGTDGTMTIWNADDGSMVRSIRCGSSSIESIAWCPSGERVAAVQYSDCQIFDITHSHSDLTVADDAGNNYVTWNPDGTQFVTAADDGTARLWDARGEGTPLILSKTVDVSSLYLQDAVNRAMWSADGKRIATAGEGTSVSIWTLDRDGDGGYDSDTRWDLTGDDGLFGDGYDPDYDHDSDSDSDSGISTDRSVMMFPLPHHPPSSVDDTGHYRRRGDRS